MTDLSQRIIERYGFDIFDRVEDQKPSVFKKDWWTGKAMDWAMKDEDFKVQLFRFVDVFPTLKSSSQLAKHLQEYFGGDDQNLPSILKWGISKVAPGGTLAKIAGSQIRKQIEGMASNFIAGRTVDDALPELRDMWEKDIAFTLDLLGEATLSQKEAQYYDDQYHAILDELVDQTADWPDNPHLEDAPWGDVPRINVSVKITSLYSQLDPVDPERSISEVKKRLRPLFRKAKQHGAFINLDVEQYKYKDLTFAVFKSLLDEEEFRDFEHAGIVVQAYLKEALEDVRSLCNWARQRQTPVTVRLVKGAYWDYETVHSNQQGWPNPVYTEKWKTDKNYERATELLLDHYPHVRTAIGSHNVRSIAHAMAYADAEDLDPSALEFQMLFGMAEPLKESIRDMGYRLREYVPVGEMIPGMAYLVRRLLENTSNESWLRHSFAEQEAPRQLLADPADNEKDESPEARPPHKRPVGPNGFRNEPHRDFSQKRHRESMETAVDAVSNELGQTYRPVIGGETVSASAEFQSTDPAAPDRVVGRIEAGNKETADRAVRRAREAADEWAKTRPSERADCILELADLMRNHRDELSAWIMYEVGKNWREADGDICEAIDFCEYYARQMKQLGRPDKLGDLPGEHNLLSYRPRGVAAVIAPWNFPLAILTGMTTAAAVTGNTVVMKPAEQSSVIAAKLMELVRQSSLPPGVINYVPGRGESVGAHLVDHSDVDVIAFTGSKEVGLGIVETAGQTDPSRQREVKRVVCEMGGKNAIVVDADADLDEAVDGVVRSAFGYQGQKCSACSRVIVHDECYERFRERLVEATRSLVIGPAYEPGAYVGPVVDEQAKAKIRSYIEIGRKEGEQLLHREVPETGHYVEPTIFEGIVPDDRIAREEIFGPVLALMRADSFETAIDMANRTQYGLTGGVYSRSPENLRTARRNFDVGNLYINRDITGALVYRQPFGGFKMSGIGAKAGGPNYLLQFMQEKVTSENTMRQGFAPEAHL